MRGLLIEDDQHGMRRAIRVASLQRMHETIRCYRDPAITWAWVTNFDDFKKWIVENGLPDVFAFDHDLGGNSYELYDKHGGYSRSEINYDEYDEPTGYHCAKWLTEYCQTNKVRLESEVHVHSMNAAGRKNITSLLNSFKNFQDKYGLE